MSNYVISISREFGSGGRMIGKQLAARLGGTAASFVGKKTCALAKEHRQPLLLAAAVVSGVLAVGSVVLWLVCRKK